MQVQQGQNANERSAYKSTPMYKLPPKRKFLDIRQDHPLQDHPRHGRFLEAEGSSVDYK